MALQEQFYEAIFCSSTATDAGFWAATRSICLTPQDSPNSTSTDSERSARMRPASPRATPCVRVCWSRELSARVLRRSAVLFCCHNLGLRVQNDFAFFLDLTNFFRSWTTHPSFNNNRSALLKRVGSPLESVTRKLPLSKSKFQVMRAGAPPQTHSATARSALETS